MDDPVGVTMYPSRRWWPCVPPLVAFAADVSVTLLGQPPEYWAGDSASVIEGNPVARWLLVLGPWPAVAAGSVYAFGFSLVVRYWRHGHVVAFLLTASHTFGTSCWLVRPGWPGWVGVGVAFVLMERVWVWCRGKLTKPTRCNGWASPAPSTPELPESRTIPS